jgi:hypothetical protein
LHKEEFIRLLIYRDARRRKDDGTRTGSEKLMLHFTLITKNHLRDLHIAGSSLYKHLHTYINIYTYTHFIPVRAYIHTYKYIHTYMHIRTYIRAYKYIHAYTYIHTYIHTCIYIHTYIHTCIYIHTYTYIYTYIHTHTHNLLLHKHMRRFNNVCESFLSKHVIRRFFTAAALCS